MYAVTAKRILAYQQPDLFDEQEWQLFARATAAASVASTLTLPILDHGRVVGTVNLYGATPEAFEGNHDAIAAIFDAWAPGAIKNADLSFTTRRTAEQTPDHLRDDVNLAVASGIIAVQDDVTIDTGRQRLHEAAQRAGVNEAQLARTIIELRKLRDSE